MPSLVVLLSALGALAVAGCGKDSAPAEAAAPDASALGTDGSETGAMACGPGRPGCAPGTRCEIAPSCLPPEQRIGVCVPGQEGCAGIYVPACGCDGKTTDICAAYTQGLAITHNGPCLADAAKCTSDSDCVLSPYDRPVASPADCYCRACGNPLNLLAANNYQSAWKEHCEAWSDAQPCITPACAPPTMAIACVEGRCQRTERPSSP